MLSPDEVHTLLEDARTVLITLCARYGYEDDGITPKKWAEWKEARRVHEAIGGVLDSTTIDATLLLNVLLIAAREANTEALAELVRSWDALPGGDHKPKVIEKWLHREMSPAIDKARRVLGETA